MVLTEELRQEILNYLAENRSDFQEEDLNNATENLKESNIGQYISKLDNTLITRLIDDVSLSEKIDFVTEKEDNGNVFD